MVAMSEETYLAQYDAKKYDLPLTMVDIAVFSIIDDNLYCLLVKRGEHPYLRQWSLPGGFIDLASDDDIDACAKRKLVNKTGVKTPYLEQVMSVGNKTRDPRGWSMTVLYFALIDYQSIKVNADNVEEARWIIVDDGLKESLAFDHNTLLECAVNRLKGRSIYTALPMSLLPEFFTLSELQRVFEIVLGTKLEKKSFRRRVQNGGAVIDTKIVRDGHYPASLFKAGKHSRNFAFPRPLEPSKQRSEKK